MVQDRHVASSELEASRPSLDDQSSSSVGTEGEEGHSGHPLDVWLNDPSVEIGGGSPEANLAAFGHYADGAGEQSSLALADAPNSSSLGAAFVGSPAGASAAHSQHRALPAAASSATGHNVRQGKAQQAAVHGNSAPKPVKKSAHKPTASANQSSQAKASTTTPQVPNPTYVDALHLLEQHFRREAEIAGLFGRAANDGFEAFKIRSSTEYNKSSSRALQLFEIALTAIPAGGAVLGVMTELTTGAKKAALVARLGKTAKGAERVGSAIESIHKTHETVEKAANGAEEVKKVYEAGEKIHAPGEAGEAKSEAKERGDFQIETIHNLTELQVDSLEARWGKEDLAFGLLRAAEYSVGVDLVKDVDAALYKLPDPGSLKEPLRQAADNFELQLYLDYYVEAGKATYETIDTDDQVRHEFHGIPSAVVGRFDELGKKDLLLSHPKLHRKQTRREWHGSKF